MVDRQHNVKFEYTPLGSLKMREENGVKVRFDYNTEEQLHTIRNEHKDSYQFTRDANGQITRETGFDGITRQFNRDRAGKVLKIDRSGDRWTEYEYNLNGKITRAEHFDGTWETYSYDKNGRLVAAVNEQAKVKLVRDGSGRVIEEYQNGHKVQNKYNSIGLRTKISSSLGAEIDSEGTSLAMSAA